MKNVSERDQVTLPCNTSRESSAVWQYEKCCDEFKHGLHLCSIPMAINTRSHYQIRRNAPGDFNLLISDVTKNMTGIYTCRDRHDLDMILYRVLLNVVSEYINSFYCP